MRILFGLIIPTLLIILPICFQIVYTVRRIKDKTQMSLLRICLLTFVLGLVLSIAATYISILGLSIGINPGEPQCITGISFFTFFGIGLTLILTPMIGIAGALIVHYKRRRTM
jgi:uncharacterized membrane protein